MSDNGNGFNPATEAQEQAFQGALINLSDLKREDGILTRANPASQSLLHRVISAIDDNKNYRNELKTALFATSDEADNAVAALEECFELGMDATPIIDQIIARSAGRNHELLFKTLETLNHSTFTTNYRKGVNNSGKNKSSPIA